MASPLTCLWALSWAMALRTPPFTTAAVSPRGTRSSMRPPPLADDTGLGIALGRLHEALQQQFFRHEAAIRLRCPHVRDGRVVLAQRELTLGDRGARPRLAL